MQQATTGKLCRERFLAARDDQDNLQRDANGCATT